MFIIQAATTLVILLVYVVTLLKPIFCPKPQQNDSNKDTIVEVNENVTEPNIHDVHGA